MLKLYIHFVNTPATFPQYQWTPYQGLYRTHIDKKKNSFSIHYIIIIEDATACGGTAPPPTTTAPPPPTGCGSPQWANDQWCDDENNNANCNYDGGACCFNNFSGKVNSVQEAYTKFFALQNESKNIRLLVFIFHK